MFLQEPLDPLPIHGDEANRTAMGQVKGHGAGQRPWDGPVLISLST